MAKRNIIIEVAINNDSVSSIEDLEREILFRNIYGQVARKYLDSLQHNLIEQVDERKRSKRVHIKTSHFEFDFQAKRTFDEMRKKSL